MKNKLKILILYPPLFKLGKTPQITQNRQTQWFSVETYLMPLVASSATTLLKKNNFDVELLDCIAQKWSYKKFIEYIKKNKFDLISMEAPTPVIKDIWRITNQLKQISPKTKVAITGTHVTALPDETLRNSKADFIVTGGDWDFLLLNLSNFIEKKEKLESGVWYRKNNKIKNTGSFKLNHNLDKLPFIDRDLCKWWLYQKEYNLPHRPYIYIMSARDCPWHRCSFCSWTTTFPSFRARSVKNVLDEIGMLIKRYKIKSIFDDSGTFPPGRWLEDFCKGMVARGYNKKISVSCNMRVDYLNEKNAKLMKQANFCLLKIGLESANQSTLDKLNKGTKVQQIINACKIAKKYGLKIHLTIMTGFPFETKKQALKTFNLAKYLMQSGLADILQSTIIIPYPGTPLHEMALKKKWFRINPKDYEKYDMSEPILKTKDMSPKEIIQICDNTYKIYLSPKYILTTFKKIRSFNDIKYILRGAKAVFGHIKDFSK